MYNFENCLHQELEEINYLIALTKSRLQADDFGHLILRRRVKQDRYYECDKEHRHFSLLGDINHPRVGKIQEQYFLQKRLQVLEKDRKQILRLMKQYEKYDPVSINATLPLAYRRPFTEQVAKSGLVLPASAKKEKKIYTYQDLVAWAAKPYEKNTHEFNRKHYTSDGAVVRSLGEVIVYDTLKRYGIPFRSDMKWNLKNWNDSIATACPDFTFLTRYGWYYFWEDAGMLDSVNYRHDFHYKLDLYYRNDITPGVNLIITASTINGSVDSSAIDRAARSLLPLIR